ncbi:MAG: hypothetical protein WDN75_14815 [Bacteroidota bacterium]
MKKTLFVLALLTAFASCSSKKAETTSALDSLAVDSVERVTTPAPSSLAFDLMTGYTVKNSVVASDSVNFVLLTSQEDLEKNFTADKSVAKPDFVINYIIGVIGMPSSLKTGISLDKVEAISDDINVYVNIQREKSRQLLPGRHRSLPLKDVRWQIFSSM